MWLQICGSRSSALCRIYSWTVTYVPLYVILSLGGGINRMDWIHLGQTPFPRSERISRLVCLLLKWRTMTRGRRICAILMAAAGLGDSIYCGNGRGSPYCSMYYRKVTKSPWILPKSRSHCRILPKSQGHGCFSCKVTQSQPNFKQSQIATPVATVSIVHIGVTTLE